MKLDYLILTESINVNDFCCGTSDDHQKLNKFLKERAIGHQKEQIGTTTIIFDRSLNNKAIGYITLLADSVKVEKKQREHFFKNALLKNKYKAYPALQIGRIAVDQDYQRKGVGTHLFRLAVAFSFYTSNELGIGIRFLVVHSKDMAKEWYLKKLNFRIYDESKDILYYDLLGWKDGKRKIDN